MFNYRQWYHIWTQWSLQNKKSFLFADKTLLNSAVTNIVLGKPTVAVQGPLQGCAGVLRPAA